MMVKMIKIIMRWLGLLLVMVMAIAIGGCNPAQFKSSSNQVSQLVFSSPSNPSTFNSPINTSAFSGVVFSYIEEGLLNENGLTGELEPGLAKSWEVSEDKKRVIFTLREGLKWSDGEPLTTDDIIFTYQDIYLNEKIASGMRDILRIGKDDVFPTVKKLDSLRVEFSVPEPFVPFIRYAGGLVVLPAHILKESVHTTDAKGKLKYLSTWGTDTDPKQIISSGPYRMTRYIPGQRIIFERNPYYWRKDLAGNQQPYIERIVVQIIESTENQLISFRSGALDHLGVTPGDFPLLKREETRGKFKIYNGGSDSGTTFLGFNLNQAKNDQGKPFVAPLKSRWFHTLAFRQAVAYALDRETMKNNIFRGLGEIQNSPIYVKSPYYLSPEKGLKVYNYNPDQAKQLLLGAGFKYNRQGQLIDGEGNRVEFTLLVKAEEKTRVDMATQIQQDLSKIGIKANLQVLSFNSIIEKLSNRDWECYVGRFGGGGGVEPHNGANIWLTTGRLHQFNQGSEPGEPPIQGWKVSDWEKEIDRLFIAGSQEFDETKRKEIYAKFQQIAQEQLPFIHLVNPLSFEALRDRIKNVKFSAIGGALWNTYELKVSE